VTAVLGILVGIVGGAAALIFASLYVALIAGFAQAVRETPWPGLAVAVVAGAWMIATLLLIASLPVMLGAWIADAGRVSAVAGRIAGYCFWPALVGFPLAVWLGGASRSGYDAG
jgi:hypothetical protein